jgi:hypothetical protein
VRLFHTENREAAYIVESTKDPLIPGNYHLMTQKICPKSVPEELYCPRVYMYCRISRELYVTSSHCRGVVELLRDIIELRRIQSTVHRLCHYLLSFFSSKTES